MLKINSYKKETIHHNIFIIKKHSLQHQDKFILMFYPIASAVKAFL